MTELDKKIIALIEPYMMKDLVEGCLVTADNYLGYKTISHTIGGLVYLYGIEVPFKHSLVDNYKDSLLKIIGHYCISAVLKYLDSKTRDERGIPSDTMTELSPKDIHFNYGNEVGLIPLKPLNLYTEEEKQKLLDLLTKIK